MFRFRCNLKTCGTKQIFPVRTKDRSVSQSQQSIWFLLPTGGANHITIETFRSTFTANDERLGSRDQSHADLVFEDFEVYDWRF